MFAETNLAVIEPELGSCGQPEDNVHHTTAVHIPAIHLLSELHSSRHGCAHPAIPLQLFRLQRRFVVHSSWRPRGAGREGYVYTWCSV